MLRDVPKVPDNLAPTMFQGFITNLRIWTNTDWPILVVNDDDSNGNDDDTQDNNDSTDNTEGDNGVEVAVQEPRAMESRFLSARQPKYSYLVSHCHCHCHCHSDCHSPIIPTVWVTVTVTVTTQIFLPGESLSLSLSQLKYSYRVGHCHCHNPNISAWWVTVMV